MRPKFNSTYRLQFNPEFKFTDAHEVIDYLARLGITAVYASPIFHARRGSTHGYDIVDHRAVNPDLGSEQEFRKLNFKAHQNGLAWLQDIVPNHMAIDSTNTMLMDIFEAGEDSRYYDFFEIDWDHPYENMHGKMLVPLLGKLYAECLADGEIQLGYDLDGLSINYYDVRLPLRIQSYPAVFKRDIDRLENELGGNNADFLKFLGTLHLIETISSGDGRDAFYRQVRHVKRILFNLYSENETVRRFVDDNIAFFNGDDNGGRDALDWLISEQLFRLSFWKVATEEINYRRFFTVNDLISVNIEKEEVFNYTHDFVFRYLSEGHFDGLRIDHIDGLFDPETYLRRLRERTGETYIVIEKILEEDERLPADWPIEGTTGYEFLNNLNSIFCDNRNRSEFSKLYYKYTGLSKSYEEILHDKKKLIIEKHMAGNIDNLAQFIKRISSQDRYGQDITLFGLKRALVELIACFPVYRTYINNESPCETDREIIDEAINSAREKNPDLYYELRFIEKFLLLKFDDSTDKEERQRWLRVIMSFQQFTGPVMAKGFEDTMLYIYNRLTALNEVGSNPNRFGVSVDEFHKFNSARTDEFPLSLSATSTHDTKRGEDTRARILVLSEIPSEWDHNLKTYSRINRSKKKKVSHRYAPDRNDEYFLYQTLLGTYPFEVDLEDYKTRIKEYVIKAVREAKVHTAWIKPDNEYEEAYLAFIDKIFKDQRFFDEFLPFQQKVAGYGVFNSLAQVLMKMTAPGLPDFYQGCEYWDLTLVDPDNRRQVDFKTRSKSLQEITKGFEKEPEKLLADLIENRTDGRIKQFLIHRALSERNRRPELYLYGDYIPLECAGQFADNVIAFARRRQSDFALTIVPRFFSRLMREDELPMKKDAFKDTVLKIPDDFPSEWVDMISREYHRDVKDTMPLGDILNSFPVALLANEEEG